MFGAGSGAFPRGAGNTSGFGQSAFGNPTAPAMFGQMNQTLFNQTTQPNTVVGQTLIAQPKFEGFNTGGASLFGPPTATPASGGGLFGQLNASMGRNTGSGLFGSNNPNTSFEHSIPVGTGYSFGTPTAQPMGNIFGRPQTSTAGTGIFGVSTAGDTYNNAHIYAGTFDNTSGFGGTIIKFNPVAGTEAIVTNSVYKTINTRNQSITVMIEYESKTFEELRFEDYSANRKVGKQGDMGSGMFRSPKHLLSSATTASTGLFGANDNKSLFGITSTTSALGFAAPQTNIFGNTFPSTFGTQQTTGFYQTGFGQPNQNNPFEQNKPAFGFGSTETTTGFSFGTNTSILFDLFGNKPVHFGSQLTNPSFGTNNAFGATSAAQPAAGNLFGSHAFNKVPTTSLFNQPTNQQTGVFNNAAKPGELFGKGTGLFGSFDTTSFGTEGPSFFGNSQQSGLGLFGNTNNDQLSTNQVSQSNKMQLQLDTLKEMPYGDSSLFKRFYKDVSKVDDSSLVRLQNVSLEEFGSYKVSPILTPKRIRQIRRNVSYLNHKSLFDRVEESPPTLKCRDKLGDSSVLLSVSSPRLGCKKLNLKKYSKDRKKLNSGNRMVTHTGLLAKLKLYFSNKQNLPEDKSHTVSLSLNEENNTISQLQSNEQINLNTSKRTDIIDTSRNNITDTVVIDNQEPSIYPNTPEAEDHPTGIKLRRVGYYTIPPMNKLAELVDDDGSCFVDGFTIGRYDYGNVYFPNRLNVAGLDLDSIVHIRHREVVICQDDEFKPLGEGLNRKATVTLDRVWPNDKTTKQPITNPDHIAASNFVVKLQKACANLSTQFVDYRSDTGSWVFNVKHFSKYDFVDSDDEDEENIVERSIEPKTLPKPISQKSKTIKSTETLVQNKMMYV